MASAMIAASAKSSSPSFSSRLVAASATAWRSVVSLASGAGGGRGGATEGPIEGPIAIVEDVVEAFGGS